MRPYLLGCLLWCLLACNGRAITAPPLPDPSPTPQARLEISVRGDHFEVDGQPLFILGAVHCCDFRGTGGDEGKLAGWPLVTREFLDQIANAGLNYVHIRLGPHLGAYEGPEFAGYVESDGVADLSQINTAFLSRARSLCEYAAVRGVVCEVAVLDAWVVQHELSPWSRGRNRSGVAYGLDSFHGSVLPVQAQWIAAVGQAFGGCGNCIFTDANEAWKGVREPFFSDFYDRMRLAGVSQPIGTNTGTNSRAPLETGDFVTYHGFFVPPSGSRPVMVTEYGSEPLEAILEAARTAKRSGVAFHYWQGIHDPETRARGLVEMGKIRRGQ